MSTNTKVKVKLTGAINQTPSVDTPNKTTGTKTAFIDPEFPIHVYPEQIKNMLTELSDKQGLPTAYTGTMLLSYLAAAVGSSVRLQVSGDWIAPLCLWTCIVGDSGTRKTPVMKFLSKPFVSLESQYQREYDRERMKFKIEMQIWEKDKTLPTPKEPFRRDILVKTGSIEGLKDALFKNPRGVLLARDEMTGFIRSLNQYKGKGDDQAVMLELYNGDELKDTYSTKETRFIPFTNTCLTGGIQTDRLAELMQGGRDADGFTFRFLFTFPSGIKKNKKIYQEGVSPETMVFYKNLIFKLAGIDFIEDENLDKVSNIVKWCKDGFKYYETWYSENADLFNDTSDKSEKGVLSKLEGIFPRLALLLQLIDWQCQNPETVLKTTDFCVKESNCLKAKELIEYFRYQAMKIQAYVTNNPVTSKYYRPSGIDWDLVFGKKKHLQRKEIIARFKELKQVDKIYNISDRSIDGLFTNELYKIGYGVFTHINPNEI